VQYPTKLTITLNYIPSTTDISYTNDIRYLKNSKTLNIGLHSNAKIPLELSGWRPGLWLSKAEDRSLGPVRNTFSTCGDL